MVFVCVEWIPNDGIPFHKNSVHKKIDLFKYSKAKKESPIFLLIARQKRWESDFEKFKIFSCPV